MLERCLTDARFGAADLLRPKTEHQQPLSDVWVLGNADGHGMLGLGEAEQTVTTPTKIPALSNIGIYKVVAGERHVAALTVSGLVYIWGDNTDGALGLGVKGTVAEPTLVKALKSSFIKEVALGEMFTVAVTSSGNLFGWGKGRHGMTGHGGHEFLSEPTAVRSLPSKKVKLLATGGTHCIAATEDNQLFGWGRGSNGRFGDSDTQDRLSPAMLGLIDTKLDVVQLAAGFSSGLVLAATNTVILHYKRHAQEIPVTRKQTIASLLLAGIKHWRLPGKESEWVVRDISGCELGLSEKLCRLDHSVERLFIMPAAYAGSGSDFGIDATFDCEQTPRKLVSASKQALVEYVTEAPSMWTRADLTSGSVVEQWDWFLLNLRLLGFDALEFVDSMLTQFECGQSQLHSFSDGVDDDVARSIRDQCHTKRHVLRLLTRWMERYPHDIIRHRRCHDIVDRLLVFVGENLSGAFPALVARLRHRVEMLTAWRPKRVLFECDASNEGQDVTAIAFKHSAVLIAEQLTLRAQQLFVTLNPRELTWQLTGDSLDPAPLEGLSSIVHHYHETKAWARMRVLEPPSSTKRAAMFGLLVGVMNHCMELGNFHSAAALCAALCHGPLLRVFSLREQLSPARQHQLQSAEAEIRAASSALFSAVALPPIDKDLVAVAKTLPFVGFLLRDLKLIDESNAATVENGQLSVTRALKIYDVVSLLELTKRYGFRHSRPLAPFVDIPEGVWDEACVTRLAELLGVDEGPTGEKPFDFDLLMEDALPNGDSPLSARVQSQKQAIGQLEDEGRLYLFRSPLPPNDEQLERRQKLWRRWEKVLEEEQSSEEIAPDGSAEYSFLDAFRSSECIAFVVESAIRSYPLGRQGEATLCALLAASLMPTVSARAIVKFVRHCSKCPLNNDTIENVAKLILTFRPETFTKLEWKRKQTMVVLSELEKAKAPEGLEAISTKISDDLEMTQLSNDIMRAYSTKLDIGEQQFNALKDCRRIAEEVDIAEVSQVLLNPMPSIQAEYKERAAQKEKRDKEAEAQLTKLVELEQEQDTHLDKIQAEEERLLAQLREVRAHKARCLENKGRLAIRKRATEIRQESDSVAWAATLQRHEAFLSSVPPDLTEALQLVQMSKEEVIKAVDVQLGDATVLRDVSAEECIFAIVKHLDSQQDLLNIVQAVGSPSNSTTIRNVLQECERMLHHCRTAVARHHKSLSKLPSAVEVITQLKLCGQLLDIMLEDYIPGEA